MQDDECTLMSSFAMRTRSTLSFRKLVLSSGSWRDLRVFLTLCATLAGLCTASAKAQSAGPSSSQEKLPRLTLGSSSGVPGGTMVVPVYFAPAGFELGKLRLESSFVSRNLKFAKFTRGSAA